MLWPVPDGAYNIYFIGRRKLEDITDTSVSLDPYFGPITEWFEVFSESVRIFHDLNNNEDSIQIMYQRKAFETAIKNKKRNERLSVTSSIRLEPVNALPSGASYGRFDPAHYDNG